VHRTFKVPAHTIVKPMMGLSFSASKSKSPIRNRNNEAVGALYIKQCVCVSLLYH
jgi:hypothetical protein